MESVWPLVGREDELGMVRDHLAARTGPLTVSGPAGVGKSRLVSDALAGHNNVTWVRATRAAQMIPFGCFAGLLPADASDHSSMFMAIRRRLANGEAPVVVVDDAHLLDDASAALIHGLALESGVIVVATVRSGEPAPDVVLQLWRVQGGLRLDLQALARAEVAALLEARLGGQVEGPVVGEVWTRTRGNPLFIVELVDAARASGTLARTGAVWRRTSARLAAPDRLTDLLSASLTALSPEARQAAELIALGEPIRLAQLESLSTPDALAELDSRALLVLMPGDLGVEVHLAHPLYGEVLRASTSPLRRRRHLLSLAAGIGDAGGPSDRLRAVLWRLDAGELSDPGEMLSVAEALFAMTDFHGAERVAAAAAPAAGVRAVILAARAVSWQGRHAEAEQMVRDLDATSLDDTEFERLVSFRCGNYQRTIGGMRDANVVIEEAEQRLTATGFAGYCAQAKALLALYAGRPLEAIAHAEQIRAADDDPSSSLFMSRPAILAIAWAWRGSFDLALRILVEADRVPNQNMVRRGGFAVARFTTLWSMGHLDDASRLAESWYESAQRAPSRDGAAGAAGCLGRALLAAGQPGRAARFLNESIEHHRLTVAPSFYPGDLADLSIACTWRGDSLGAEAALREAQAVQDEYSAVFDVDIRIAEAWSTLSRGSVDEAVALTHAAAEAARRTQRQALEARALHVAVRMGRPRSVVGRLEELADAVDGPLVSLQAGQARALVTRDANRLMGVGDGLEGLGQWLLAAEAFAQAAATSQRQDDAPAAAQAQERARRALDHCERFQTPAISQFGAPLLTRRELQIAALAAEGRPSAAIADRLHVSVRTVDNHLGRIYAKLGVSGRSELRAALNSQIG